MELVSRTIQRYVHLKDAERKAISAGWLERSFMKGSLISNPGTVEQWFYIVKEGVQRMYYESDGNDHCLGFSYDHSWSGDFDSFVPKDPVGSPYRQSPILC
ncbi:MAG: hypothetical protein M3R08_09695 [Bacteroidota bacterium]|nr:hypothetical protein [Bacteroidota bacterium]